MQTPAIVYVLTGVATVIVVLTRIRLGRVRGKAPGASTPSGLLAVYTISGLVAVVGWLSFLSFPEDRPAGDPLVGVIALFFWWLAALVGLRMVTRRPARGKHSAPAEGTKSGHAFLVVAQVVLLVAVAVFTWAYTTAIV